MSLARRPNPNITQSSRKDHLLQNPGIWQLESRDNDTILGGSIQWALRANEETLEAYMNEVIISESVPILHITTERNADILLQKQRCSYTCRSTTLDVKTELRFVVITQLAKRHRILGFRSYWLFLPQLPKLGFKICF